MLESWLFKSGYIWPHSVHANWELNVWSCFSLAAELVSSFKVSGRTVWSSLLAGFYFGVEFQTVYVFTRLACLSRWERPRLADGLMVWGLNRMWESTWLQFTVWLTHTLNTHWTAHTLCDAHLWDEEPPSDLWGNRRASSLALSKRLRTDEDPSPPPHLHLRSLLSAFSQRPQCWLTPASATSWTGSSACTASSSPACSSRRRSVNFYGAN